MNNMNYVTVSRLRSNLADTIKRVVENKDYLLIGKRNEVKTALVDIDLFEDLLELNNKKYLASIKKAREDIKNGKILTHEEVFGEI